MCKSQLAGFIMCRVRGNLLVSMCVIASLLVSIFDFQLHNSFLVSICVIASLLVSGINFKINIASFIMMMHGQVCCLLTSSRYVFLVFTLKLMTVDHDIIFYEMLM